jgi:predicted metalloprotease
MGVRQSGGQFVAAIAATVVAGCGVPLPGADTNGPVPTHAPPGARGTRSGGGERVIAIPSSRPAGVADQIPGDGSPGSFEGADFDAYQAELDYIVFLVDQYWSTNFPPGGIGRYSPPRRVIAYYPDTTAPRCGGDREQPGNADYCSQENFIAFDEPGFMVPFYIQIGPVANATILAHEWGHVIQVRIGLHYRETVEKELNADCLAGVWAADAIRRDIVEPDDLAEAKRQLLRVGDVPGTPWTASNAHGDGPDRVDAFELGEQHGVEACLDELEPGFSRGRPGVVP